MNDQEKAAFFEKLCQHGIMLCAAAEGNGQVAQKMKTMVDDREYFDAANSIKMFQDRDAAIEYLKGYIDWTYEAEPEPEETPEEPVTEEYEFIVTLILDLGFGPQNIDLGTVKHLCGGEGWRDDLQQVAEDRAQGYVIKNYPEKEWDKLSKQVNILPVRPE